MKSITLWYLNQLALIIICESGVNYKNQVGGYSCLQEEAEGVLVIIDDYNNEVLNELIQCTLYHDQLTEEKAIEVNSTLSKYHGTKFLSVDMDRYKESKEAWIYINVDGNFNNDEIQGFTGCKGILTWENSD